MSTLLTNTKWVEARQKEFTGRTDAVRAFWPEMKRAFFELIKTEPAKSHVVIAEESADPRLFVLTAGIFDLKLAADPLSDTVFYAFTSATLKRLAPAETPIYHHGQLKLTQGAWGVIDGPGDEVHRVFADDPQTVTQVPLADRFAQWALEQLLGGYPAITALGEAVPAKPKAQARSAKKEARRARGAAA